MKKTKSIITALLAVLILVSCAPVALADNDTDLQGALDVLTDESTFQSVSDLIYDMTGDRVDDMGELAELIKAYDMGDIADDLKLVLDETSKMSDEELLAALKAMADENDITLPDKVISLGIRYLRSMEGLSEDELELKLNGLRDTAARLMSAADHVSSFGESVGNFFGDVGSFFRDLFN